MLYNAFEGYGFVVVDDTGEDLLDEICRRFNGKWQTEDYITGPHSEYTSYASMDIYIYVHVLLCALIIKYYGVMSSQEARRYSSCR